MAIKAKMGGKKNQIDPKDRKNCADCDSAAHATSQHRKMPFD